MKSIAIGRDAHTELYICFWIIGHVQFFHFFIFFPKSLNAIGFGDRKQTRGQRTDGRTRMTLTDDVDHHTEE